MSPLVDLTADARFVTWLRVSIVTVLVVGLIACSGDDAATPSGSSSPPPGVTEDAVTSNSAAGNTERPTSTTADLDGRDDSVPPPDPTAVPTSAVPETSSTRATLPGFGEVVVQVRRLDGQVLEWCLLLAETVEQRSRGLMEVTDPSLGGYDGMLFRFDAPIDGAFYMRNTPQPLSIAYVDETGALVSVADMAPCEDVDGCPTYDAAGPFRWAVEAPAAVGGVADLGLEPGAVLVDARRTCAD